MSFFKRMKLLLIIINLIALAISKCILKLFSVCRYGAYHESLQVDE